MNKIAGVLIAIGAGVAIGAALGVLYAPDEGAETRKRIVKRSKKLMGAIDDTMDEGRESLEEIRVELQKQLQKVNRKIEEVKN